MTIPHLPPELVDHIIHLLRGSPKVLRNCCLVSKSWIPRTRRYLYADIEFRTATSLQTWKRTFLDPLTSPACYANTLSVACTHVVTAADAQPGGWIRGFSNVVHLEVGRPSTYGSASAGSLISFHALSPILKSLHVHLLILSPSRVLDLILSFPLLEDLTVTACENSVDDSGGSDGLSTTVRRSSGQPMFTGSLELTNPGIKPISLRLLSLPGGIHFRKLVLKWSKVEDLPLTTALVDACSHTLESLDITYPCCKSIRIRIRVNSLIAFLVVLGSASLNLSKATKLGDVVFRLGWLSVEWVTTILQTITPMHRGLRHISIYMPPYLPESIHPSVPVRRIVGEEIYRQWSGLDRLLIQLWESHSIRTKVGRDTRDYIGRLLPAVEGGGVIDLVE